MKLIVWRHKVKTYVPVTDVDAAVSCAVWGIEENSCYPLQVEDDDGKIVKTEQELKKLMEEYREKNNV